MTDTIADHLASDLDCDVLLTDVCGLTALERDCFQVLEESDAPLRVEAVADRVDRAHSTTYRALRALHREGLLRKEQVCVDGGGRCHVYRPVRSDALACELRDRVDAVYRDIDDDIDAFRRQYARDQVLSPAD
ncbi:helix-turn-helix domain-containing protein [Halobacteriaceae archaeon GCM10025711]